MIEGGNFGTTDDDPVVLLGTNTFVCKDVDVLTSSTLTCTTPAGTGTVLLLLLLVCLFVCLRAVPVTIETHTTSHRLLLLDFGSVGV